MLRVFKHFGGSGRSINEGDQDEGAQLSGEQEV